VFLAPREFLASADARRAWTPGESARYTRWLATHHYENFPVVSLLLPKELHQDFFNVYAFCRWADDLGDEIGDPAESLRLLGWWRGELQAMYRGQAQHPVFVALRETVERRALPEKPFDDLIGAFEQDQVKTRYRDWAEVRAYCERSANPVGRLVLMLAGYRDEDRFRMSDATCTGLQLANFWQDVTVDWAKDRVYLPQDLLTRHGASDADIAARRCTPQFREAMREAVAYARDRFVEGLPLARTLDRRLSLDIELFSRGGLLVLDKIERQNYNVLRERPKITKVEKAWLLLRGLSHWALRRTA
jgi:squalene synthase HpnC